MEVSTRTGRVYAPEDYFHDVAVVGLGPVGATLAHLLAIQGLSVLVLERDAEVYRLPRAIHFDGECMRVFQACDLSAALLPQLFVSPGMKFIDAAGHVLIDYSRPQALGPQGWHPSYRFHQPAFESLLRDRLADHPAVDIRLRHEVFAIDEDEEGATLRVEDMTRGRLYRSRVRWVVGCDGARSLVRRLMGTELDDLQSHERWLVLDLRLHADRPDLGDHSLQICDPARPATYVRAVGLRRRWELMLMPGDDVARMTSPEAVWPLLSRWIGPKDAELERAAVYTFHSVVARGWRRGRLLIAGDAAHQTPPFMGQGMCAGIRDASNLAWKLAQVVHGHAPTTLLDSYESERAPHVQEFIETAVRLGALIQTTDPEIARRRDAEMAQRPLVLKTPQPPLGPGAHDGGVLGGRLPPQVMLDGGLRLDDCIGYRHALLATSRIAAAARSAGLDEERLLVIEADQPSIQDWLQALGVAAVLLRPDRYVAGVIDDPADLNGLLERHHLQGMSPVISSS